MGYKELPVYYKNQIIGYLKCDPEDYEFLKNVHIYPKGINEKFPYPCFKLNGKRTKVHRWVMGITDPKIDVDHISHDLLDVRKQNLRTVNRSQNAQNRAKLSKNNTSGYRNVTKVADDDWRVSILFQGQYLNFGRYTTAEKANEIAILKRKELGFLEDRPTEKISEEIKQKTILEARSRKIRKDSKNGYLGIRQAPHNNNLWQVYLSFRKRRIYVGTFNSKEEAILARIQKKLSENIPLDYAENQFIENNHVPKQS